MTTPSDTAALGAAIDQAIDALGEARRFIHAESPHEPTERELRRVADVLSQARERVGEAHHCPLETAGRGVRARVERD